MTDELTQARSVLTWVEDAIPEYYGPKRAEWLERLQRERDTLNQALTAFLQAGDAEHGLRLAMALREFWMTFDLGAGRAWIDRFLALPEAATLGLVRANALDTAGALAAYAGDAEAARSLIAAGLEGRREIGEPYAIANSLIHQGTMLWTNGEYEEARTLFDESRALYAELGHPMGISVADLNLAQVSLQEGEIEEARTRLLDSSSVLQETEQTWTLYFALDCFAALAAIQGQADAAQRLRAAAAGLRERIGLNPPSWWHGWIDGLVARGDVSSAKGTIGDAADTSLSLEEALDLARAVC